MIQTQISRNRRPQRHTHSPQYTKDPCTTGAGHEIHIPLASPHMVSVCVRVWVIPKRVFPGGLSIRQPSWTNHVHCGSIRA